MGKTVSQGYATHPVPHIDKSVYSVPLLCDFGKLKCTMVDIAQQVEQLIVVQQVARSSRVIHPHWGNPPLMWRVSLFKPFERRRPVSVHGLSDIFGVSVHNVNGESHIGCGLPRFYLCCFQTERREYYG